MSTPWSRGANGGVTLQVRVTPKGGRDAIAGIWTAANGRAYLALKVSAPPADGAANEAVRRLVAKEAGLPCAAVTIEAGAQAREKRLRLDGDTDALLAWLETLRTKE